MPHTTWTDDLLDPMRKTGDRLADDAIEETYALGRDEQVRAALTGFGKNSAAAPTDLPPKLEEYFAASSTLPTWADPHLIERGTGLLGRYQGHITTTLLCSSLPTCYSCGDGAQVLDRSTRLTAGVFRRLMETSQFVVDVLDTGGLGPGGRGVRSAQKIRLLHATMRYHLSGQDDWDTAWGLPVNQEDLVGTLMSFSVTIPQGLARLGVDLPAEDRDAFFHIWRVIGHILGVDERLNPVTYEDGEALLATILRRQQRPSEAGTRLTKSVLDFIGSCLPGPAFAGVGPSLVRHLAGDPTADLLSVPAADLTSMLLNAQSTFSWVYGKAGDTLPLLATASNELGLAVFKQGLRLTNMGRRYEWQVPTGLTPTD